MSNIGIGHVILAEVGESGQGTLGNNRWPFFSMKVESWFIYKFDLMIRLFFLLQLISLET